MIRIEPNTNVWCITGNLGGGKTLSAVSMAFDAFQRGYFVAANFDIKCDAISQLLGFDVSRLYLRFDMSNSDFNPFNLPTGSPRGTRGGKRVVVIVDEVAEWFDQFSNSKDGSVAVFLSWLRHSSKRGQDVVLICQRLDFINKSLRLLVSRWVICDDMMNFRFPMIRIKLPFLFPYVMQRVFTNQKKLVQGPVFITKSFYGRFYNTAQNLAALGNSSFEYSFVRYPNLYVFLVASLLLLFLQFSFFLYYFRL